MHRTPSARFPTHIAAFSCVFAMLGACGSDPPPSSGSSSSSSSGGESSSSSASSSSSGQTSSSSSGGAGGSSSSGESSSSSSSSSGNGGSGGSGGSAGAGGGGSGGGGIAVPIVVQNPGFEANPVADGTYTVTVFPTGWTKYDPNNIIGQNYNSMGILNPTGTVLYPAGAPEGKNVALVFLWRMQTDGIPVGFSQQLTATVQPKTLYTLQVRIGNIAAMMGDPWDLTGFPGYRVELLAGNTVLAQDNNTLLPNEGTFLESKVVYSTGAADPTLGQPLGIRLINLNNANSGIEVNFDDVRLDALVMP